MNFDVDREFESFYGNENLQNLDHFYIYSPNYSYTERNDEEQSNDIPQNNQPTDKPIKIPFNEDQNKEVEDNSYNNFENYNNVISNQVWYNKNILFTSIPPPLYSNLTKKSGRKTKEFTGTGGHDADAIDNLNDKCWRDFLKMIKESCNYYSKPYGYVLQNTNFKKQFGSSIIQNKSFTKIKIYQYLTYNPPIKENCKFHRNYGSHNKRVIRKMIEKNNIIFIALIKLDIEIAYKKYKNRDNTIVINNVVYTLEGFKTIDDMIKELRQEKDENGNIIYDEKKIAAYIKQATNLIEYITGDREKKKRKKALNVNQIINYLTIEELELD